MAATESSKKSDALAMLRISGRDEPQPPSVMGRLLKWMLVSPFFWGLAAVRSTSRRNRDT
jgi:hypothetical protein